MFQVTVDWRANEKTTRVKLYDPPRIFAILVLLAIPSLAEEIVVTLPPALGPLDNPLKGWCPYTNAGKIHQPYSMVYFYVPWSQLEPSPGEYRFDHWEQTWNVPAAERKHIVFRVYVDYPGKPSGLPAWLQQAGVKQKPYQHHGSGLSPDYDDPKMIAAMLRLIEALGKRYNEHPRIAFIQLGLLGFWGEWHTWPQETLYASPQTERRVIDAYHQAFPNKSLMVRYARNDAGQQPWIGFHDDMFPQDTDNGKDWSFLAGLRASGRTENWKQAVIGGEMVPHQASRWLGRDFALTTEMLKRSHFTWVGPYCPALEKGETDDFRKRSQAMVRAMGYEFQLTQVRHTAAIKTGQKVRIELDGKNTGVAPFYYPWSIEWALIDAAGKPVSTRTVPWDVRRWQPGLFTERSELQFDSPPGRYQLAIGIRDPWQDRPAIGFANQLQTAAGWTILSELRVIP